MEQAAKENPMPNITGKDGRLFGEQQPGADEVTFREKNTSADYYNSVYFKQHLKQLRPVPVPTVKPPHMDLTEILDPGSVQMQAIQAAKKISFHTVGDTGAARATGPATEASVADRMAGDLRTANPADAPVFFFHLGDVVYNFGESQYYYDQFYEPFRAYDRPIFAIPGNHDGMVYDPNTPSLKAFLNNFCAAKTDPAPDAAGLVRSLMTQPGVYFTLDAPFVSIIGLYSNVLEGPGVISSQGGKYSTINDDQLGFLKGELQRLKASHDAGERAVILAVHHPPLSADGTHGGADGLWKDINDAFGATGLFPDAVLSGHAHLYQRFTHRISGHEIPYVVSGSGGFNIHAPMTKTPPKGYTTSDNITIEVDPVVQFGYLLITVDMASTQKTLTITFNSTIKQGATGDQVIVDLGKHQIMKSGSQAAPTKTAQRAKSTPKAKAKPTRSAKSAKVARGTSSRSKSKK
jgi:hypothetical protein